MRSANRCLMFLLLTVSLSGCQRRESAQAVAESVKASPEPPSSVAAATVASFAGTAGTPTIVAEVRDAGAKTDTAMFAGGCFWSMERPFAHVPGVVETVVGYAGGHTTNPTYEQVNTRTTGHAETVRVVYNPSKVSYAKLLDVYWHNIDPVTKDRQFCDGGSDYRTIIFAATGTQRDAALASKAALMRSGHFKTPIVTEVVEHAPFWRGEEYHQHFADRNPERYDAYRRGCGRDARLRELWGDTASPFVPHL